MQENHLGFWCAGCREVHTVAVNGQRTHTGATWGWNGSYDKPTFTPSILIRTGHYVPGQEGKPCWCTYNAAHPDKPAPFTCSVCHSFVTDGRIRFLEDCTHALAGQTVDLVEPDLDKLYGR